MYAEEYLQATYVKELLRNFSMAFQASLERLISFNTAQTVWDFDSQIFDVYAFAECKDCPGISG